jgi:hypothetical protein
MAARDGTAHANMIHTFFPITVRNSCRSPERERLSSLFSPGEPRDVTCGGPCLATSNPAVDNFLARSSGPRDEVSSEHLRRAGGNACTCERAAGQQAASSDRNERVTLSGAHARNRELAAVPTRLSAPLCCPRFPSLRFHDIVRIRSRRCPGARNSDGDRLRSAGTAAFVAQPRPDPNRGMNAAHQGRNA